MIGFKNPNSEAEYRESTQKRGSIGSTYRTCHRCGERFPPYLLRRTNATNTRRAPTRWYCKECFAHVR